jgi:hypothetical protein
MISGLLAGPLTIRKVWLWKQTCYGFIFFTGNLLSAEAKNDNNEISLLQMVEEQF